ncbi:hypothetical protein BOTBODRAFT_52696 [Botryobasidium botryosum FD-172 SS1]|uniref:Uncharacterized protein n=1 Tax=Botryobasidium botryosum (strain FD-172 SS1) TaxID=930990 RepID=A0A067MT38_BOTB1|nr:hypothetical protein BOTBODRAFT_52696 [Botryobasidium botryosum FD-172 SS1]
MLSWKGLVAMKEYKRRSLDQWPRSSHLHLEIYFLSLMIADLMQAIGSILHINWIVKGRVAPGIACTTQAVFKQLGDVGVALSTLAITIHTFRVLYFQQLPSSSPLLPIFFTALIWITAALMVSIGYATHHGYYGPTGYWCWIVTLYKPEQIATEYGWMWFTVIVNLLLYIPLFFRLRSQTAWVSDTGVYDPTRAAQRLLWCPLAYTITIIPMSISRFLAFYGHTVPFQATVLGAFLLASSGVINVTLYTITRPRLHPAQARHCERCSATALPSFRTQIHPEPVVDLVGPDHDRKRINTPSFSKGAAEFM